MFIAKWNKSVILTYVGLIFTIVGIYICLTTQNILHALSCNRRAPEFNVKDLGSNFGFISYSLDDFGHII